MRPPRPVLIFALIASPLVAAAAYAVAAPLPVVEAPSPTRGLVIVLRPPEVDELTRIALGRVTGELTAARFRVAFMPLDLGRDPGPQVEVVAPESNPVAVFAMTHISDRDGDTIAIWVCDRLGRRTTIQRMAVRGDNIRQDAEVLALEAIELIRVSIAGLWPLRTPAATTTPDPGTPLMPAPTPSATPITTTAPATDLAPTASAEAHGAAARPPETAAHASEPGGAWPDMSFGLGVAALKDGGQSAEWMGGLTVMARWPGGLATRLTLAGLGSPVSLTGVGGTAELQRVLTALGGAWFWPSGGPIDFFVSVALGAAHVEAKGATTEPARAVHDSSAWVPTGSGGVGVQIEVGPRLALGISAEVLWAWSRLDVAIGDSRTSALLRPAAFLNLGLHAGFWWRACW